MLSLYPLVLLYFGTLGACATVAGTDALPYSPASYVDFFDATDVIPDASKIRGDQPCVIKFGNGRVSSLDLATSILGNLRERVSVQGERDLILVTTLDLHDFLMAVLGFDKPTREHFNSSYRLATSVLTPHQLKILHVLRSHHRKLNFYKPIQQIDQMLNYLSDISRYLLLVSSMDPDLSTQADCVNYSHILFDRLGYNPKNFKVPGREFFAQVGLGGSAVTNHGIFLNKEPKGKWVNAILRSVQAGNPDAQVMGTFWDDDKVNVEDVARCGGPVIAFHFVNTAVPTVTQEEFSATVTMLIKIAQGGSVPHVLRSDALIEQPPASGSGGDVIPIYGCALPPSTSSYGVSALREAVSSDSAPILTPATSVITSACAALPQPTTLAALAGVHRLDGTLTQEIPEVSDEVLRTGSSTRSRSSEPIDETAANGIPGTSPGSRVTSTEVYGPGSHRTRPLHDSGGQTCSAIATTVERSTLRLTPACVSPDAPSDTLPESHSSRDGINTRVSELEEKNRRLERELADLRRLLETILNTSRAGLRGDDISEWSSKCVPPTTETDRIVDQTFPDDPGVVAVASS